MVLRDTYPSYDDSPDASAWFYGLNQAQNSGGAYAGHAGTTANRWGIDTVPLNLQPGTYYLTEVHLQGGFTQAADLDEARFCIFEDDSGTLTPITFADGSTYVDMTSDIVEVGGSGADIGPTTVASLGFTIEAGKSYQMAWGLHKAGTTDSRPGVMRMANGQGPQGLTCYTNAAVSGAFPPTTLTGTANSSGEIPRGYIKFTTAVRKLVSDTYAAAKDILIPYRTDGHSCIKFRNLVVAADQAFTCVVDCDNGGNNNVRTTMVVDMGLTDKVTFGSADVNLNGVTPEAGDAFDFLMELRGATNDGDLFWINKDNGQGPLGAADPITISHKTKASGARGGVYDLGTTGAIPQFLRMSGTAAVENIEVGWQPVLLFGDSQLTISVGEGDMSSTNRLGYYLPRAFTHPRIYWLGYKAGKLLTAANGTSQTAGYLCYKSTTPGQGDLCEMVTPLFMFCIGINDISVVVGTTEGNRNKVVALMGTRAAEIFDDLQDRDVPLLVIGLPPYSNGDASEQEAQCVLQWNACLEGLAVGVRASYHNPWHSMCGGDSGAAIPTFTGGYSDDAGLHYNSAGAAIVAASAVRAYESGIVGGWVSNPARRYARKYGMLMP
jgi:hypothetical protein